MDDHYCFHCGVQCYVSDELEVFMCKCGFTKEDVREVINLVENYVDKLACAPSAPN